MRVEYAPSPLALTPDQPNAGGLPLSQAEAEFEPVPEVDINDEMHRPGHFHSETLNYFGNVTPEEAERAKGIWEEAVSDKDVQTLLGMLAERNDNFTLEHSKRVAWEAMLIAMRRGFGNGVVSITAKAGLTHDVGKVEIQDLVYAERSLTGTEQQRMATHSARGAAIIAKTGLGEVAEAVGRDHHSLKKEADDPQVDAPETDFPRIVTQMVATADVADSLSSVRSYRAGIMSSDEVIDTIRQQQNVGEKNLAALAGLRSPQAEPAVGA